MKFLANYRILGYDFRIETNSLNLLQNQIQHISKFCITSNISEISDDAIIIKYEENMEKFKIEEKMFYTRECNIINTFGNERHYFYEKDSISYYMQLPSKYIVKKYDNKNFEVIGDSIKDTTKYLFRIIREIIVRLEENNQKLTMHGTGIAFNGKGILLLGDKGAGKTTLFSKLLSVGENTVLSNDRVFLYVEENKIKMDYFPIPVVYKAGTVINNIQLNNFIKIKDYYSVPVSFWSGKESFPVPLTDLIKIFPNTVLSEKSNVDIIIFSKIIFTRENILNIRELDNQEFISFFYNVCFTPVDTESSREVWIYPRTISNDKIYYNTKYMIDQLIKKYKIVYLEYSSSIEPQKLKDAIILL